VKTVERVFLFAGVFGVIVAAVYWLVAYEAAGTVLLTGMGIAALVMGGYSRLEARRSNTLPEDRADATHEESAGASVGVFPIDSLWPLLIAGGAALTVAGLVYGLALFVPGVLLLGWALTRLALEDRR
jgi:cytochrome c oxidase subunit IV